MYVRCLLPCFSISYCLQSHYHQPLYPLGRVQRPQMFSFNLQSGFEHPLHHLVLAHHSVTQPFAHQPKAPPQLSPPPYHTYLDHTSLLLGPQPCTHRRPESRRLHRHSMGRKTFLLSPPSPLDHRKDSHLPSLANQPLGGGQEAGRPMGWSGLLKPRVVHRLSSLLMVLAVATHHAGEGHAMSPCQDRGRTHQPNAGVAHGLDLGGAGVRGGAGV